jgi:hypothetical protein
LARSKGEKMKKILSMAMEWIRPIGISCSFFLAYYYGRDAISIFHILGPFIVIIMNGSIAFESLVLGEVGSEKIGYAPNRAYQIQSGLANLAMACTALLVLLFRWGREADATIVIAMLLFLLLSGSNHLRTAIQDKNWKPINLLRPVISVILTALLLPYLVNSLLQKPL